MRPFDFAPLYRSTVGFDRLVQLMDSLGTEDVAYPPYNIERVGEDTYKITMAVAGFSREDINVEVKDTTLSVRGEKAADKEKREFLYRGIAERGFSRRFQLADHVEVTGADLKDGLLHIDLKRSIPERLKPRTISIGGDEAKQIEG